MMASPFEFKTESGGGGTGADPMAFPHDWHRGVLADFLDAIEKNREPRISGAEGAEGSPLHRPAAANSLIRRLTRRRGLELREVPDAGHDFDAHVLQCLPQQVEVGRAVSRP